MVKKYVLFVKDLVKMKNGIVALPVDAGHINVHGRIISIRRVDNIHENKLIANSPKHTTLKYWILQRSKLMLGCSSEVQLHD